MTNGKLQLTYESRRPSPSLAKIGETCGCSRSRTWLDCPRRVRAPPSALRRPRKPVCDVMPGIHVLGENRRDDVNGRASPSRRLARALGQWPTWQTKPEG